jgi:hypothetical protein
VGRHSHSFSGTRARVRARFAETGRGGRFPGC